MIGWYFPVTKDWALFKYCSVPLTILQFGTEMEDKIYPNPIRHCLIQGLTSLILVTNSTSELSSSGQPLLSAFVQNYGLVIETCCIF